MFSQAANDAGPIGRLRAMLNQLDGMNLKIARWLMGIDGEGADLARLTTGNIAETLAMSRTSVVRFCRFLGYDSFAEFRAAWLKEAAINGQPDGKHDLYHRLPPNSNQITQMTVGSIFETLQTLDMAVLHQAVAAIAKADTVFCFGCGDSAYLAGSAVHKFTQAGKKARVITDVHSMLEVVHVIGPGDVLILFSQSGIWQDVCTALGPPEDRAYAVIAVTSQAGSPIALAADFTLLTAARDITVGKGALTFRAPQCLLIDILVLESLLKTHPERLDWREPKLISKVSS